MKKILSTLKAIKLNHVLTVILASVLVLFNTACSRVNDMAAKATGGAEQLTPGQVQPYEGGMNNFSDVDTSRLDTSKVDARAKALKDRVERNIDDKRIDSVDQYVENYRTGTPIGERTERFAKDIRRGAEDFTTDVQGATERGSKNLERNLDRGSKEFGRTVDQAKENAKSAGQQVTEGVKDLTDKADNVVDRAADAVQGKVQPDVSSAKRTMNNAS